MLVFTDKRKSRQVVSIRLHTELINRELYKNVVVSTMRPFLQLIHQA